MAQLKPSDTVLTALAVICGIISVTSFAAAVNLFTSAQQQSSEGVDIAAAAAAATDRQKHQDLLNWAIEHSDPQALKDAARTKLDPAALQARRKELREVLEAFRQELSEADLMKAAIEELTAAGATDADKVKTLGRLRDLVRAIDNANDLRPIRGIEPLLAALSSSHSESVRGAAAEVLGQAASNNVRLQQDVAAACPDIIARLLQVLQTDSAGPAARGSLYALGSFLRNSGPNRQAFYSQGGLAELQRLYTEAGTPGPLRSKALDLVSDLARDGLPAPLSTAFLEAVTAALEAALPDDWAALERTLQAASGLASRSSTAGTGLQAAGLGRSLDAARAALLGASGSGSSTGAAVQDGDDEAWAEELLALIETVRRQAAGAAQAAAASARAAAAAEGGGEGSHPAADGGAEVEVMMLGPAGAARPRSVDEL